MEQFRSDIAQRKPFHARPVSLYCHARAEQPQAGTASLLFPDRFETEVAKTDLKRASDLP